MTDHQLDEFEHFIDADDEASALDWIERHFPDYAEVVQEEWDALRIEFASVANDITSVSIAYRT